MCSTLLVLLFICKSKKPQKCLVWFFTRFEISEIMVDIYFVDPSRYIAVEVSISGNFADISEPRASQHIHAPVHYHGER